MERYYILENNKVVGPFTVDQLKERPLKVNTLLCNEGKHDWKKFSEYPELNSLKEFLPPPAPPKEIKKKASTANSISYVFSKDFSSKLLIIIGVSLILGVSVGFMSFYMDGGGESLKQYNGYHKVIKKYNVTNVNTYVSDEMDAELRSSTNWALDRWAFRDILHAESYFKVRYQEVKSHSITYGIVSTIILLLAIIIYFVVTKSANWVKENATN